MAPASADGDERTIETATLRERLVGLRLLGEGGVEHMRQSLRRHGQLCALAAFRAEDDGIEVVDGFKRLRAARARVARAAGARDARRCRGGHGGPRGAQRGPRAH